MHLAYQSYPEGIAKYKNDILHCHLATIYKRMITRNKGGRAGDLHITVHIPNIPQQQGVTTAGCTPLHVHTMQQEETTYMEEIEFDQEKMREYLARCFSRQKREIEIVWHAVVTNITGIHDVVQAYTTSYEISHLGTHVNIDWERSNTRVRSQ